VLGEGGSGKTQGRIREAKRMRKLFLLLAVVVFSFGGRTPGSASADRDRGDLGAEWLITPAEIGYGAGPLDDAGWDLRVVTVRKKVIPRLDVQASAYRFFQNPFPSFWLAVSLSSPVWQETRLTSSIRSGERVPNRRCLSVFLEGSLSPIGEKGQGDFYEAGLEFSTGSGNRIRFRLSWVGISVERQGLEYRGDDLVPVLSRGEWAGPRILLTVSFLDWRVE